MANRKGVRACAPCDRVAKCALIAAVSFAFLLSFSTGSWAQIHFPSYENFKVPANQGTPPPPGTVITHANWQKYKNFMPVAIQRMWGSGFGLIKFPADYSMVVGKTVPTPVPSFFLQATEKYAGQAKLVPLAGGAYTVKDYATGFPFPNPNPSDPLFAEKVFYNYYYKYFPVVEAGSVNSYELDKYGDVTTSTTFFDNFRLTHVSDPGYAMTSPDSDGIFNTVMVEEIAPVEAKYTTILTLLPDDPTKIDEHYLYLPSFRRSVRLSGAARCAPVVGSDLTTQDLGNGIFVQASTITEKYLGTGEYLVMEDANVAQHAGDQAPPIPQDLVTWGLQTPIKWPLPGWPTEKTGKWELRKAYILDLEYIPGQHNCYSHMLAYIDAQSYNLLYKEMYDTAGRLWKSFNIFNDQRVPIPGTNTYYSGNLCGRLQALYDLQNQHASVAGWVTCGVNKDNPATFLDHRRWATPAGLDEILR